MCCASCLVTSSPEFEDPEQTPPVLLATTALPDLREILVLEPAEQTMTFSAEVTSEEDLGETLKVRLFVDYGIDRAERPPYARVFRGAEVLPGTGPRLASATWYRSDNPIVGCHTFTLMVSHAFDDVTDCPESLSDSSQVTWHAFVCDSVGPCPPPVTDPRLQCPEPSKRCPDVVGESSTSAATGQDASSASGP